MANNFIGSASKNVSGHTPMNDNEGLPEIRLTLPELAGSLGDFGTILPLILAVALVAKDLNPRYILLFFGIWFIITGFYYRLPVPLEPMKVIAVIVISGNIGGGEIAAAGIMLGILFLVLGYGPLFGIIDRHVPQSVVRGIQLGLALLLLKASAGFIINDPLFFGIGIAIILAFLVTSRYRAVPDLSALAVIGAGVIGGLYLYGIPPVSLIPAPQILIPLPADFLAGFSALVVPQSVLTISNAILATSLLTKDLFGKDIPPKRLSLTIGLMNITSVPFGGFPMCHGAGGLAGQYRYGARTGGANIFAGVIFLLLALFFSSPEVLSIVAVGALGALLVFVGIEMGKHSFRTDSLPITLLIGILALIISMTIAFIAGLVVAYFWVVWKKRSFRHGNGDSGAAG